MSRHWTDDELDLGLRQLFRTAARPVAPATLHAFPRAVVERPGARIPHVQGRRDRFFAIAAAAAIVVVIVVVALVGGRGPVGPATLPTPTATATPLPSPSPTLSAIDRALPPLATSGAFTWTRLSLPATPHYGTWVFARANGGLFGFDCSGSAAGVWTSRDGLAWSNTGSIPGAQSTDETCPAGLLWDGTRYVAFGATSPASTPRSFGAAIWTSKDAATWTLARPAGLSTQTSVGSLAFGRGAYVAAAGDAIWRSVDLVSWTREKVLSGGSAEATAVVRYAGGAFVATVIGASGAGDVFESTDGRTWSRANLGASVQALVVTAAGFIVIVDDAAGSRVAMRSSDGRTWQQAGQVPVVGGTCNQEMLLCSAGLSLGFAYSADGTTWERVDWPAALQVPSMTWGPAPDPFFVMLEVTPAGGGADVAAIYVVRYAP